MAMSDLTLLRLLEVAALFVVLHAKPALNLDDVTVSAGQPFQYKVGNPQFLTVYNIYRIVERSHKKLPDWLLFNTTTSTLTGTPQDADLGLYSLKLRAECRDPVKTACQGKVSRTFHVNVVEPLKYAESRGSKVIHMHVTNTHYNTNRKLAAPDQPPSVKESIDHINVMVGRYFELQIPESTFLDKEDGNTRNLTLNVSLVLGQPLPTGGWLRFAPQSQTLYGIPLESDVNGNDTELVINRFILIATDSQEQRAKDVISITYKFEKKVTHRIMLNVKSSYIDEPSNRSYLLKVAKKLVKFYGDENLKYLSFSEPVPGSLSRPIIWANNSLFGNQCHREQIQGLYDQIVHENDTITQEFAAYFMDDPVVSADLFFEGVCTLPETTLPPSTKSPITDKDSDKMWTEIVLPALIAILVIVIIALLLLICCRHRKPSKRVPASDKPMFLEDRRPIIFPEELELMDPSMKPKDPLVLPSDYLHETPPAVPPHGRPTPPYRAAPSSVDDEFMQDLNDSMNMEPRAMDYPPSLDHTTEPPPYRLPPPYFNPHRLS